MEDFLVGILPSVFPCEPQCLPVKSSLETRKMGATFSSLRLWQSDDQKRLVSSLNPNLPKPPPSYAVPVPPHTILKHPEEQDLFKRIIGIHEAPLQDFDPGVLSEELLNLGIYGKVDPRRAHGRDGFEYANGNIEEGTYAGTQAAITQVYSRIEQRYNRILHAVLMTLC